MDNTSENEHLDYELFIAATIQEALGTFAPEILDDPHAHVHIGHVTVGISRNNTPTDNSFPSSYDNNNNDNYSINSYMSYDSNNSQLSLDENENENEEAIPHNILNNNSNNNSFLAAVPYSRPNSPSSGDSYEVRSTCSSLSSCSEHKL